MLLLTSSQEFPAELDNNKGLRNRRCGFMLRVIAKRTCTLGAHPSIWGAFMFPFRDHLMIEVGRW